MSAVDTLFGPPSEPVQISRFLQAAETYDSGSDLWFGTSQFIPGSSQAEWHNLPLPEREAIEAECRSVFTCCHSSKFILMGPG